MQFSEARFGWHAKSYDPKMASIRVRLLQPMEFMQKQGTNVDRYSKKIGPDGYDGIIFSKSFSSEAVQIARQARSANRAVIFDICDNLFEGKDSIGKREKLERVREMLSLATHIVFSTPMLARQLESIVPEISGKSRVIPDALDCFTSHIPSRVSLLERRRGTELKRFLFGHRGALHCVWFGKSQGKVSGFSHLGAAVRQLEMFARQHPVTLTVISNKRWQYWRAASRWRVPTHYMPWSLGTFDQALSLHNVAIIPVERNGYTIGKTINRPATAIAAGLGVIADSIDSYEELRPFIPLDDWQGGLQRYSQSVPAADEDLRAARQHLEDRYGREAIGRMWLELLIDATSANAMPVSGLSPRAIPPIAVDHRKAAH